MICKYMAHFIYGFQHLWMSGNLYGSCGINTPLIPRDDCYYLNSIVLDPLSIGFVS